MTAETKIYKNSQTKNLSETKLRNFEIRKEFKSETGRSKKNRYEFELEKMACIIWTGTSEPADLISKLFANEDIEAKGAALEVLSSLYF